MKNIILVVTLTIVWGNVFGQQADSQAAAAREASASALPFAKPRLNQFYPTPAQSVSTTPVLSATPLPSVPQLPQVQPMPQPVQAQLVRGWYGTNGETSSFRLEFNVDPHTVDLVIPIDADRNPATGDLTNYYQGEKLPPRIFEGVEMFVSFNGWSIFVDKPNRSRNPERFEAVVSGKSVEFTIPNEVLGTTGDGNINLAVVMFNGNQNVFYPNAGYFKGRGFGKMTISTGTSTVVRRVGQESSFDLTVIVQTENPSVPVTLVWFDEGANVSEVFNGRLVPGVLAPVLKNDFFSGRTFRLSYPANALRYGTTNLTVAAITSDGILAATSQIEALETFELPSPPSPPRL